METKMTVKDIVSEYLKSVGATGLCNKDCGCEDPDLMPCYNCTSECVPAVRKNCGTDCEVCGGSGGCMTPHSGRGPQIKIINGHYHMTAGCLNGDLKGYKPDQVIYAIAHERDGRFAKRPIYKTEQDCHDTEVYLYLSDTCEDIAKRGSFRIGDIVEWSGGRICNGKYGVIAIGPYGDLCVLDNEGAPDMQVSGHEHELRVVGNEKDNPDLLHIQWSQND